MMAHAQTSPSKGGETKSKSAPAARVAPIVERTPAVAALPAFQPQLPAGAGGPLRLAAASAPPGDPRPAASPRFSRPAGVAPPAFTRVRLERPASPVQRKGCSSCSAATPCAACSTPTPSWLVRPPAATQAWRLGAARDPAEHQADEVGARIGADLGGAGPVGPGLLAPSVRRVAERHLGVSLAGTRLVGGDQGHARAVSERAYAVTEGDEVSFLRGQLTTSTTEGRSLIGHELTHVAQQRAAGTTATQSLSWDDVENAAGAVVNTVGDAAHDAGQAAGALLDTAAQATGDAIDWAKQKGGEAVDWAKKKAGEAADWLTSTAGRAALALANRLAGLFGGTVTISPTGGIVITIPEIPLFPPIHDIVDLGAAAIFIPLLPPMAGSIGPVPIAADVGFLGWVQLQIALAVGPAKVRRISFTLNPWASVYSGTGQLYIAGAIGPRLTVFGGLAAAVGTVLPTAPPVPVVLSVEGGLRGTGTAWDVLALQSTASLTYSGGALSFSAVNDLMGGFLLQGDLDVFAAARIEGKEICHYVYRLGHWETGKAEKLTIPVTAGYGSGGGTGSIGPITKGPIPIKSIETVIKPLPTGWSCLGWDEVKEHLCDIGVLPPELCHEEGDSPPGTTPKPPGVKPPGVAPPGVTPGGPAPGILSDPCSEAEMLKRIGSQSVVSVVRSSGDGENLGGKRTYPNTPNIERAHVCKLASAYCRGDRPPAITLRENPSSFYIEDGEHRFVGARLAQKPLRFTRGGPEEPLFKWSETEWY